MQFQCVQGAVDLFHLDGQVRGSQGGQGQAGPSSLFFLNDFHAALEYPKEAMRSFQGVQTHRPGGNQADPRQDNQSGTSSSFRYDKCSSGASGTPQVSASRMGRPRIAKGASRLTHLFLFLSECLPCSLGVPKASHARVSEHLKR